MCGLLATATVAVMLVAGVTTVPALMLAAPIVTALWVVRQYADAPDRPARLAQRAGEVAGRSVPLGAPEAMTLSCAGYCGIVAAGLVDPHWFSDTVGLTRWHEYGLYAAAMLLPPLLSNVGLPPMLITTFLGTRLSGLPGLEFDPTLLAMAFCVGWSLNLTGSPLGLSAIILSRITGTPGTVLAWRWNGAYSLAVVALMAGVFVVYSRL